MWSSNTGSMPPNALGVVPKEPTRLPPLADRGEGEDEAARRRARRQPGANDMASVSRKRRDLALANREKPSSIPLTLPGTLLKSPPLASLEKRPSLPDVGSTAVTEPGEEMEDMSRVQDEVLEGQKEIQRLQEELRLRSAEVEEYRRNFKKKNEEYEGCVVLLDVAQAELRFCQERLRAQSPTPPLLKPKRLKGVGLYASEREVAEEVAAWSVSLTVCRVQRILEARKLQEAAEAQLEASLQSAEVERAQRRSQQGHAGQGYEQLQVAHGHPQAQMQHPQQHVQVVHGHGQAPLQPAHEQLQVAHGHPQAQMQHPQQHVQVVHGHGQAPLQPAHEQLQVAQGHPQAQMQHPQQHVQMVHGHGQAPLQPAHEQLQVAHGHPQAQMQHEQLQVAQGHPQAQMQHPQQHVQMADGHPESQLQPGHEELHLVEGPQTHSHSQRQVDIQLPQFGQPTTERSASLKYGLPAIQEHQAEQSLSPGKDQPSQPEASQAERWSEAASGSYGSGSHWQGREEGWHSGGDFAGDEDLDEEVSRIAERNAASAAKPAGAGTAAVSAVSAPQRRTPPAMSPVPETGGTPTRETPTHEVEELELPMRKLAATQTDPIAPSEEGSSEPAKPEKALITAQEENRVLKLVVANSKKEIAYYNQVLMEKNAEHQQELQELQEQMVQERRRCAEDMKHWKTHVKKELGRDPVLSVCLMMWEKEVTSLRTQYAFREWKRKAKQLVRNRGMQGKLTLLVELHWVLRDWRVAVMEIKAERLLGQLKQKWFNSIDQAYQSWANDTEQGLKHFAFQGWAWQKKFAIWERKSSKNVQFTLRRWFYAMDTAVRYFAFLAWYEALMETKLSKFKFQLLGKKSAFLKAVMAFEATMTPLTLRAIFYAWLWSTPAIQGTPFSKPDREEDLAPARMDQTSRFNLAFCLSAWDYALTGAVISSWHHVARHRHFQKNWMKYFRPQEDPRPILHAWRWQVQRANDAGKRSVQVEKKERDTSWLVSLLCFLYWRMKLKPSRAVTHYVPRLARLQAVAAQKLAEAEEHSVHLIIFHAWQLFMLLSQEEKEEEPPTEAKEDGGPGILSLVNKAVKKQWVQESEKITEDAKSKAEALEKSQKEVQEAQAKVAALEQNIKDLEEKNAEEKAKAEKLEEANKGCCKCGGCKCICSKSCCCIVM